MQDNTTKAHLKSAAQSFAGATAVQVACFEYLLNFDNSSRATLVKYYTHLIRQHYPKLKDKYATLAVSVALAELTYPATDTARWSGRERSALAGISKSTWHRLNLCNVVNRIIAHIRTTSLEVARVTHHQLTGKGRVLDRVMTQIDF